MGRCTAEQAFKLRFNLQSWLKEDIGEYDYRRIGMALDIEESAAKSCLDSFGEIVREQAALLDADGRYIKAAPPGKEASVVFIGDSITSDRLSFAKVIRSVFSGNEQLRFIDAGVSGWRTTDFVDELYLKVLQEKVQIAHVMLGTNGVRRSKQPYGKNNVSPSEFRQNLAYILTALKESGAAVILSTLPPYDLSASTYRDGNWTIDRRDYDAFNDVILGLKGEGVAVNDMREAYDVCEARELLEEDGVHLNINGHMILAQRVLEILVAVMNEDH